MTDQAIQPSKSKAPQKSTPAGVRPFVPSRAMMRFLAAADELGPSAPITQIAKAAKVDRDNWYQWIERPQFVEWWDKQWSTQFKLHRWKLKAIGMKHAQDDHAWWTDMMKIMGEMPQDNPQQSTPTNAIQFNLGADALRRIVEE